MTQIPWSDPGQLKEARLFFMILDRQRPRAFDAVRARALAIRRGLEELEPAMDSLCSLSCPGCRDNCCARATVWYDFRDLLFLYFSRGHFPKAQICRIFKDREIPACVHLTGRGCALDRGSRPFICTWYICSAQKEMAGKIMEQVVRIKGLRLAMEADFLDVCQ